MNMSELYARHRTISINDIAIGDEIRVLRIIRPGINIHLRVGDVVFVKEIYPCNHESESTVCLSSHCREKILVLATRTDNGGYIHATLSCWADICLLDGRVII